jgi:hypothetical protein
MKKLLELPPKIHPVLPPPLMLSLMVNASHVAPPVAVMPTIVQKLTETTPLALDSVAGVDAERVIVNCLPA